MTSFIKKLTLLVNSNQEKMTYAELLVTQELIKELENKNEDALNEVFEKECDEKMKQRGCILKWEPTIQELGEHWVWSANPVFEFEVDFDDNFDNRCGCGTSESVGMAEDECREFIAKFPISKLIL